jgi:hypothetical protein
MKSHCYLLAFLFLTISFSQKTISQNTQDQLIGTWMFDYKSSIEKAKKRIDKMSQKRHLRIESAYKGRKITFSANGNYKQVLLDGRETNGIWKLSNNTIEIKTLKGGLRILEIQKLSADILVLKPKIEGNKKLIIPKWYYTKF